MNKSNEPIQFEPRPSESRAGYAEWLALGAVAAGSVGAIVGMAASRRTSRPQEMPATEMEPESLTAPHGDKLRGAVV